MTEARPRSSSPRPATLRDHAEAGFALTPTCRSCWHVGETWMPDRLADAHGLPMDVAHPTSRNGCGAGRVAVGRATCSWSIRWWRGRAADEPSAERRERTLVPRLSGRGIDRTAATTRQRTFDVLLATQDGKRKLGIE